ncbi:MauE/DoxX family redox-associated membrane protein [Nonomuraea sediminis]|uniref:MauE/DoxX family redox-associated membrane protein n=1 Tax=Nonomuraea sediminis TaxID=2835864 RepID=UPI001BDC6929|nr:MauE/DoxX family redox-associated membrane protein [Nonomuraea sediminis]
MIVLVVRYALGIVLALAVLGKARHFGAFLGGLANFGLHGRVGRVGAFTVVAVEALAAAVAFSPAPALAAGIAGTFLGVAFTAAQTYLLVGGEQAPCLCFGTRERASIRTWGRAALVLVMGLILVSA